MTAMTGEAWLTLVVVGGILLALARNWATPDVLFLGAAVFFAAIGLIDRSEAFAGFANPGMLTVAFLFVVAAALRETGILDWVGRAAFGKVSSEGGMLRRLTALLVPMSAFLNNTPIVAMFVPIVMDWCRRNRVSPSKLLIPVSYLTILGGTCTVIGTSTNLVMNGLMVKADLKPIGLFEIGWLGVPYAIVGVLFIHTIGRRLLPDRKELLEQLGESRREYLVEMLVQPGCKLAGKTVAEAGLRSLEGLFLIEITREDGTIVAPVDPDDRVRSGDRLVFTGVVSSIIELEKVPGLVPAADPAYEVRAREQRKRQLYEAVVSPSSPLIGQTIREADFRAMYGAAVVAVHRNGERVTNKIGDIEVRAGDTLLLQAGVHFLRAHRNDPAFYLVSDVQEWRPLRGDRAWLAVGLFGVMLFAMATEFFDPLIAAASAAILMVALDCISPGEARKSVEWQVLVTIAASFGVGAAIDKSGLAANLAEGLVDLTSSQGPWLTLAAIYLAAFLLTELLTNNAVPVLLFPICLNVAALYNVDVRPLLIAVTFAASASFSTPIGYQTNMMVYGPGGYRFTDFVKIGLPLAFVTWIAAMILIPRIWAF